LLTLLLVWTAALALPLVAAPPAHALQKAPCPMEASGMLAAGPGKMDCCDHGKGDPEQKAPCKPGMACFATANVIPVASVDIVALSFDSVDLTQAPMRTFQSHPPDRTLRPPIAI
jgi:hypothetical protein